MYSFNKIKLIVHLLLAHNLTPENFTLFCRIGKVSLCWNEWYSLSHSSERQLYIET